MTSNTVPASNLPAGAAGGVGGSIPPGSAARVPPTTGGGSLPPSAVPPGPSRGGAAEQSTAELLKGLANDASTLVHQEILLARQEITEGLMKAAQGSGMLAGAGLFGLYGLLFVLVTAALALALVLPAWAAFGIVALLLLAVAAVLGLLGQRQLARTDVAPERAVEELKRTTTDLKEEIKWARLLPTRRAKSS